MCSALNKYGLLILYRFNGLKIGAFSNCKTTGWTTNCIRLVYFVANAAVKVFASAVMRSDLRD